MATGNFSNRGVDTHDPAKHYIGTRMQQGVPLLDRDWNELEDIRRYYERMLRLAYIGEGVPDLNGFKIVAPGTAMASTASTLRTPAPSGGINHQFVIGAGRCTVNGFDVQNDRPIFFNEQAGTPTLPLPTQADTFYVYLQPSILRVDSTMDTDLMNRQDINLETCVRDKLDWAVRVSRHPSLPPANTYLLAIIRRPLGANVITDAMIEDRRRTQLNLAHAVDVNDAQDTRLAAHDGGIANLLLETQRIRDELARLFWDVEVTTSRASVYFGESVSVTAIVRDGTGQPVRNALLLFATNWGYVDPGSAITNNQGRATFEVYGVESDGPPPRSDVAIMTRAAKRVSQATVEGTEAIQYNRIRFEPEEISMISLYTPKAGIADIGFQLPSATVIKTPPTQSLTVTVYAKESGRNVVRGIGCVQVGYRMWVRDWTRDRIFETARVPVDVQVGDLLRRAVKDDIFDPRIVEENIPQMMGFIHFNTREAMRDSIFVNPRGGDLLTAGTLGNLIAQEATTIIGARVQQAVGSQLQRYVSDPGVKLDEPGGRAAFTSISNAMAQFSVGQAQQHRQEFEHGATFGGFGFGFGG